MEYRIVVERTPNELEKTVNIYLKNGWIPAGGICISGLSQSQALIRERR